jgi:hypothetical protein
MLSAEVWNTMTWKLSIKSSRGLKLPLAGHPPSSEGSSTPRLSKK